MKHRLAIMVGMAPYALCTPAFAQDPKHQREGRLNTETSVETGEFAAASGQEQQIGENDQVEQDKSEPDIKAEIVVTATRAATPVQRTPITMQVLSSDRLQQSGAVDTRALQTVVPGLTFTTGNVGQSLVFMRGIGTTVLGLGAGASVATYVDGVYMSNQQQALQKFANIERIEVLKGPQATLYGRNATAGSILIVTREPSQTFGVEADASYGNYDAVTLRMSATGPISDTVSALFSVLYAGREGYGRNVTYDRRIDSDEFVGFRGAVRFEPSDLVSITVRGDYGDRKFSDFVKDMNPDSLLYRFVSPRDYLANPREARGNVLNKSKSQDAGITATVRADLGFADLNSVTSYRKFKSGPTFVDLDANDGPFLASGAAQQIYGDTLDSRQFYHETYISTDRSRSLFVTAGGNYHSERADQYVFRPLLFSFPGPGSIPQTFFRELRDDTWALFVDGGVTVAPGLRLTAGIRYSHDKKVYTQDNKFPIAGVPAGVLSGRRVDESWSPKFGIDYRVTPDIFLYASATTGFKSGGFAENDPRNTFEPEKIWSYEGGFKSSFWDRRARLNVAVFRADYTDLQVQQIETGTAVVRRVSNAESAKITGVDFEAGIRPVQGLWLNLVGEYLNTKMGNASLCAPHLPCSGPLPPFNAGILNPRGHALPNAPEWSLTGSVDYEVPVARGKLTLHSDLAYRSRAYFNYFEMAELPNGVEISQPAHAILNAQAQYVDRSGWSVALFGQNLTNKLVRSWQDVISQYTATAPLVDLGTVATTRFAPPRTYGVRFGFKY